MIDKLKIGAMTYYVTTDPALRADLTVMRKNFNQDSVGYLEGETEFL